MLRSLVLALVLQLLPAVCAPAAAAELKVSLNAAEWRLSTAAPAAGRAELRAVDGGLQFRTEGALAVSRSSTWRLPLAGAGLSAYHYLVVEYQAEWIELDRQLVSVTDSAGAEHKLVESADLIADGLRHKLIAKCDLPDPAAELLLTVPSKDSRAYITLRSLEFVSSKAEFGPAIQSGSGAQCGPALLCVDLDSYFNTAYAAMLSRQLAVSGSARILDGGAFFPNERVAADGLPFRVRPLGNNLVSPPPPPAANEEMIKNFGAQARRGAVAPLSRDSITEVKVGVEASEIYLLLAAELPARRSFFNAPEGPKTIEDVEELAVELVYENGVRDFAFPYSVSDRRHIVQRDLGPYVVPASGARLAKIVLHNRCLEGDVHLAAITVNTGAKRLFPNLIPRSSAPSSAAREPAPRAPFAIREGNLLRLGNRYLDLEIDAANAFSIRTLNNRWLPRQAQRLEPQAGLEIAVDGRISSIKLDRIEPQPGGFDVFYTSDQPAPLEMQASVRVEAGPEARFLLTVTNRSTAPLRADIRFPKVNALRLGQAHDLWYFFPKYGNALSSAPATFYSQAGFSYPMQFFDLFNPTAGGGLYLLSKDLSHKAQRYFLSKGDSGATFYLEYPALYTHLPPGQPYRCTETMLGVHRGDWHAAAQAYHDWVKTWYRPYKAQQDSKAWYRQSFWLLCELADGLEHETLRLPPWYDRQNNRYLMRDILEEFSRDVGATPDILHFWGWNWGPRRFGLYGPEQYGDMGGLDGFRAALDDVQKNLKIPVSLYLDGTLCSTASPFCESLSEELAMRAEDGKIPRPFGSFRMCHYTRKWQEYLADVYPRVYRETGAPILYVDELGSPNFMCWSPHHGHPVPLNMNEADYAHLKAIREATPEQVALYGEYPVTDVTSQFWDCNITYHLFRWAEQRLGPFYNRTTQDSGLSRAQVDALRFLFPRVVQLNLPIAERGSWHFLKQIFFNGCALYDAFWDRFPSKGQKFWTHAYRIMKEYRDCFATDTPETLVSTEHAAVAANRFPGNGRTVWTLYNQAYTTVRAPVLAIEHAEGATYQDLWTGRTLNPVIRNGKALISLELEPQGIGCVLQTRISR